MRDIQIALDLLLGDYWDYYIIFLFYFYYYYLGESGLSFGTWDLRYRVRDLSLQCADLVRCGAWASL